MKTRFFITINTSGVDLALRYSIKKKMSAQPTKIQWCTLLLKFITCFQYAKGTSTANPTIRNICTASDQSRKGMKWGHCQRKNKLQIFIDGPLNQVLR